MTQAGSEFHVAKPKSRDKLQLKNTLMRTSLRKTDGSPGILIAPHMIFPHYLNNYLHIIYFNYFHAFHRSQGVLLKGKINTISRKAILQEPHSELISSQYNEPQNKNCPINNEVPQSSHATPFQQSYWFTKSYSNFHHSH